MIGMAILILGLLFGTPITLAICYRIAPELFAEDMPDEEAGDQ